MAEYGLNGRIAVVTGAASGIGQATARLLAEEGARVIAVDRNEEKLRDLVRGLTTSSEPHMMIVKELRPVAVAGELVQEIIRLAGRIDILVNSAGVCHFTRINEITPEEWDEVIEIDLRSLFFLCVATAEAMDPKHGGRIVNLSSNAGRKGRTFSAHYAAAKAGVINLSQSITLAYGSKNITCNSVCPGPIDTGMWDHMSVELGGLTGKSRQELFEGWSKQTPLGRVGTVEDVANLIVFLASDKAAFINGQDINVCGGFMLTS